MTQREHKLSCMAGQVAVIVMMAVLVCTFPARVAWTAKDAPSCLSATGEAAVTPCRRELLRDPGNVKIRFALSDAFMAIRRYEDAVAVLREGLVRFPGNGEVKRKLILAESYVEEQQWIEKQQKSASASSRSKKQNTQIRLSIIRCKKLKGDAAMTACNEGLRVDPDHPELLTGRGNAWLEMDRLGNAILDYEAAIAADPKRRDAINNLRLARTKRDVKVAQCLQTDGRNGLDACDAALLKGASDEFPIQKRRARLLHTMGREKEAMAAYRVAARLNPADIQTKQALAALTPRAEKPTPRQEQKPSPIATKPAGSSAVKPLPAAGKKLPVKPVVPTAPPIKVAVAKPVAPTAPSITVATVKPVAPTAPPIKVAAAKPVAPTAPSIKVAAVKPVVPAAPPMRAATAKSEPPAESSPAKTVDSPEVKKPVQGTTQPSTPLKIAASQPKRRYSNAPEVPGITH